MKMEQPSGLTLLKAQMEAGQKILTPPAFTPQEAEEAWREWQFNCGSAAICGLFGLRSEELRPHLKSRPIRSIWRCGRWPRCWRVWV
jgi:hypothetical protein